MGLDTADRPRDPLSFSGGASPEKGSNFFFGFLILPKAKRRALEAVYAYCRLIDDIVDSQEISKDEARKRLDFWREEVERIFTGSPTHPVARALEGPVKDFRIPKEPFLEMIRGCAMDLDGAAYKTFADLESYLQGVACSVGRMVVEILGYRYTPPDQIAEFVRYFGYAFQMTNILRDVGEDLKMGRVYLPEEDMKNAGYSRESLMREDAGAAFERLMEAQYQRTKVFYARARNNVDFRDRPGLACAEIMGHIYEEILEELRREKFPVLSRRVRLSPWQKARQALKAWLFCHGIYAL